MKLSKALAPTQTQADFGTIACHALMAFAVAAGVFARFKGLGKWPFSGDEFHTVQAVQYILEKGFPEFPFGGYYTRGLLLQYLMAFSSVLGLSAEFGYRIITVLFNLSAFPAVYMLGRKISGRAVACAAVATFSLSLWEIEFARYARMYAPFQAVFIWYVYFLYSAVIDGKRSARWWMLGLSLLSIFLYEGGIFLLVLNFLPLFFEKVEGRLAIAALSSALLLGGYWFLTTKFGTIDAIPPLPDGHEIVGVRKGFVLLPSILGLEAVTRGGISGAIFSVYFLLNLLFVSLLFWKMPQDWREWRGRLCLALVIIACAMNLFLLAFLIGVACLLLEWITIEGRFARPVRLSLWAGIFNFGFLWTSYLIKKSSLFSIDNVSETTMDFLLITFRYPDLLNKVIYQGVKTFPVHFISMILVISMSIFFIFVRKFNDLKGFKFLSSVIIILMIGISAIDAPYNATRYTFFIYPLVIIIFCFSIYNLLDLLEKFKGLHLAVFTASILSFYAVSEDFSARHAFAIDSQDIFFRKNMNKWQRVHFYPNIDTRGVAQEVIANFKNGDIMVSRIRPISYYLSQVNYVFYPESGSEFRNYSASRGTREKWTGAKLIYREDDFWQLLEESEERVWLITQSEEADWIGSLDARLHDKFKSNLFYTSLDGRVNVYLIPPSESRSDFVEKEEFLPFTDSFPSREDGIEDHQRRRGPAELHENGPHNSGLEQVPGAFQPYVGSYRSALR